MVAKFKTEQVQPSRPVFEAITTPYEVSPEGEAVGSSQGLVHVRDHAGGRDMAPAGSTAVQDDNSWDEF
jgi:hypothetical protein